jgi:hypothetical protein
MTFPQQIAQSNAPDNRLRIGTVSRVNPLLVGIQGEDVVNPGVIDRSFGFQVGDVVALLRQDQTWLVFGRVWSSAFPQAQAGTISISLVASGSFVQHVDFARPFLTIPSVSTNMNTGVGPSAGWGSRAINVTTTGFDIFIFGTAGTFTAVMQWQAQEMTQ